MATPCYTPWLPDPNDDIDTMANLLADHKLLMHTQGLRSGRVWALEIYKTDTDHDRQPHAWNSKEYGVNNIPGTYLNYKRCRYLFQRHNKWGEQNVAVVVCLGCCRHRPYLPIKGIFILWGQMKDTWPALGIQYGKRLKIEDRRGAISRRSKEEQLKIEEEKRGMLEDAMQAIELEMRGADGCGKGGRGRRTDGGGGVRRG